nr:putative ribonuclease H-like domain-containing protein [Tanacetum cinerariifolium]
MTDCSLWEVILNGDSHVSTRVIEGVVQPVAPTTAEQRRRYALSSNANCKPIGLILGTFMPPKPDLVFHDAPNGNPQHALKDKGVIDSGCSRHMTGNMSYLFEFKEINGGYIAFGGSPEGGKILDESTLWHRRLGHINFNTVNKLVKGNFVRGLPTKVFENNHTCVACKKDKQHRASYKTKPVSSASQPLQRLHMDLFGPTFIKSLNKKSYCLVVTDDYSRFTWVFLLATKDKISPILKTFITGIENQLSLKVKIIRSDNGTEFKNNDLNQFCGMKGIKREFSVPRTPQQNRIAERKNRTLIEAARTMLADSLLPIPFWAEAYNTACYVQNRVLVTKPQNKTPYELLLGRTPSIDLEEQSLDDLFNSLKIYEAEIDADDLEEMDLKWKIAMLTVRARQFLQRTRRNLGENGPTSMGFDMSKVECYNCHIKGNFARECRSPKDTRKNEEEPTIYALMAFTSSSSSSYNEVVSCSKACTKAYATLQYQSGDGYHVVPPPYTGTFMPPRPDLVFHNAPTDVETVHTAFTVDLRPTKPDNDLSHTYRPSAPIIEDWVSDSEDASETKLPQTVPSFVQPTKQVKSPRPSLKHVETSNPKTSIPKPTSKGNSRNRKACFVLVTKSKLVPINTAGLVSTVVLKPHVTRPRPTKSIVTKPHLPPRRHNNRSPSLKASTFSPQVTDVKVSQVNAAKELNGGYVAFGGNPKGGKISSKGKIKTGKLDFDDVYFVNELKFNLFSVSHMCDKKNSVLFTDTECLVLSPEFKLPDDNQVLLRVPRENNMYNVNLKNIVPSGDLTCLFAKATLDESNLWHRRMGHINFKTMSNLVKDSLFPIPFWVEAVNTACYVHNRVLVTKPQNKTPYELLYGRTLSIGFMRPFGCPVTILNTLDSLGKFDGKVDEGFLVGYS